jgi:tRNA (mo5U34)-methyltransferase
MSFQLPETADIEAISRLLEEKEKWLSRGKKGVERYRQPYEAVRHLRAKSVDVSGDVVRIGEPGELSADDRQLVYETLRNFMPWRKGPFEIFGIEIDAEWRSERKWNRLAPFLPDLRGKLIADVGSNNGYYMFRMARFEPRGVIGFEPYIQHYYNFKTMNSWAGFDNLRTVLLGVEHIGLYESCFDVVFLMGILYHRSSPIDVLQDIRKAMTPGGTLIVESQGIPGDGPHALFPEKTYAKVPGTYFVPTGRCLINWLKRAGFEQVELFCSHPMSSREQRRTEWMVFESYEDFIDAKNPALTVEGYPAPVRLFARARKKG